MKILEFKRSGIGLIAEFCGIWNGFPNQGGMHGKNASNRGKAQATTSWCNKKMRGQHNTNTSAMAARQLWRQW
jgi:hypothetical protein